jgi:hypothetical protein
MRAFLGFIGVAATLAIAPVANAVVIVNFDDGKGGLSAGETSFATFSPGSLGGVTGSGFVIQSGNTSIGADPAVGGQGDPYIAVQTDGVANFSFAGLTGGGVSQVGLDYGSADTYNYFTLAFADGTSQTFSGQSVIDVGIADGNQGSSRTNGRLTFASTDSLITQFTLGSTGIALEADNIGVLSAVPEPSTWAMLLIGFGAIGAGMRRRKAATPRVKYSFA